MHKFRFYPSILPMEFYASSRNAQFIKSLVFGPLLTNIEVLKFPCELLNCNCAFTVLKVVKKNFVSVLVFET